MKIRLKHSAVLFATVALLAASSETFAQEEINNGWKVKLGVSYRSFDDVEFGNSLIGSSGNEDPNAGPAGVQGYDSAQFAAVAPTAVTIDFVQFAGSDGDVDSSDSWAPVIGVEKLLYTSNNVFVSLVGHLQYYDIDISGSSGNVGGYNKTYGVAAGNFTDLNLRNEGLQATTTVSFDQEFEMKLAVLDLGVKTGYAANDKLSGYAAIGPTLSYADIDSSRTASAQWDPFNDPVVTDTGSATSSEDDDDSSFRLGAYISLGLQYALSEQWTIGAEGRYDEVFGANPGTDVADIDLDGFSGQLKIIYSF